MRVFSGEWLQEAAMDILTARPTFGRLMIVCFRCLDVVFLEFFFLLLLLINHSFRKLPPQHQISQLSLSTFSFKIESVLKISPWRHQTQIELLNRARLEELNCVLR